ncbi:MAG: hypothetical protein INQ03_08985 [Candidatus Heimdallarchaeota archaeon]|nr:hypothetical protein [Candidatus Heimdallarchaeota archaeon]
MKYPPNTSTRVISKNGIMSKNFFYTSSEFRAARRIGKLGKHRFKDGMKVEVKYSTDDIRFIFIKFKDQIMKLSARTYHGDNAIWRMVDQAMRENRPVSEREIALFESILETKASGNQDEHEIFLQIVDDFRRKGELNKKQQRYLSIRYPKKGLDEALIAFLIHMRDKMISEGLITSSSNDDYDDYEILGDTPWEPVIDVKLPNTSSEVSPEEIGEELYEELIQDLQGD